MAIMAEIFEVRAYFLVQNIDLKFLHQNNKKKIPIRTGPVWKKIYEKIETLTPKKWKKFFYSFFFILSLKK